MSTVVDLNFTITYTPPAAHAVDLNFGPITPPLPDPAFMAVAMEVPAALLEAELGFDENIYTPFGPEVGLPWNQAVPTQQHAQDSWLSGLKLRTEHKPEWRTAVPTPIHVAVPFVDTKKLRQQTKMFWQEADKVSPDRIAIPFIQLSNQKTSIVAQWQEAISRHGVPVSDHWIQLTRKHTARVAAWNQALPSALTVLMPSNVAKPLHQHVAIPWQDGKQPAPGRSYYPPEIPEGPEPYVPSVDLNFQCPWVPVNPLAVLLNFGPYACMWAPVSEIPVRKVYFIVNNVAMKRVSDNLPIEVKSVSAGLDHQSKMWSLTAAIPRAHLERVEPSVSGPVEVQLNINGLMWKFLVEEYDSQRQFASSSVMIKGRSRTAYLDAPYAPTRSLTQPGAIDSRAFAEAELTRPGLVTGFTLDWDLVDPLGWLMPANTWSYSDLTPLQVIQQLVEGGGGFVNSHPSDDVVQVRPEYPSPYWEWAGADADLIIPKSVVRSQTLRWSEKPQYNGVYVTGENTGVAALVKRTGTAGELQAPMFVNPMISASAAARQKGLSILSAGGKQAEVTLEMPLLSALGLVTPGLLIEVTNGGADSESAWRGLVRGVAVSASFEDGLSVQQSITLERHYGGL